MNDFKNSNPPFGLIIQAEVFVDIHSVSCYDKIITR